MKYIKTFQSHRNIQPVNEEFIGGLIKGALGKLFNVFSAPFKDLAKDLKNAFKEDDPNSMKGIIMTNLNQAIDGAQKEINNLKADADILGIMDNMVKSLVDLGNGLDNDFDTAFGKGKSKPAEEIAKAIILGNKEADWVGIVGLLDPNSGVLKKNTNYKFSKSNFVTEVNKGKDLKEKKVRAGKFLDDFQKDIKNQLDKGLTEEEIKKLYDEAKKKGGGVDYKEGDEVIYMLKEPQGEYDPKKKPEDQAGVVAVGKIDKIDGDNISITSSKGVKTEKKMADIKGKVGAEVPEADKKALTDKLKEVSQKDPDSIKKITNYVDFVSKGDKDKIAEVEKIIGGESTI
jgi:hypothetical protein